MLRKRILKIEIITENPKSPISNEDMDKYAAIMRSMWEKEDNLMGVRFTWFTTLQGLLFATLGLTLKEKMVPIVMAICLLGIVASFAIIAAFSLGRSARKALKEWWHINLSTYAGPSITGHIEEAMTPARLFRPWRSLPIAFILAWGLILVYAVSHSDSFW